MPRNKPFRKISIDEEIAQAVERRMAAMQRTDALTTFVEWLLKLYCLGYLVESDEYKRGIMQQVGDEFASNVVKHVRVRAISSKTVQQVGPAKGVINTNEGKRKVA